MKSVIQRVLDGYKELYGTRPDHIVVAPGRVNLIGDHTDYCDGYVLPMTIDRFIAIALSKREDQTVSLRSLDFEEDQEFYLNAIEKKEHHWIEYAKGVAWALQEKKYALNGFNGVVAGNIPHGAGLSSSAALELVVARAFEQVSTFKWDQTKMALICQQAENGWVGMNCGIMDQLIIASGEENKAMLIDCRSLKTTSTPLPSDCTVVVLDTTTRRGLVDSAYNERRSKCEEVAKYFKVGALRDITEKKLKDEGHTLDKIAFKRAHHVVTENGRVIRAAEAMKRGDAEIFGQLMIESHQSLRDDFNVSANGLDTMVECALKAPGCIGARMTGAGFGGCCVALVKTNDLDKFINYLNGEYECKTGMTPKVYTCYPVKGATYVSC